MKKTQQNSFPLKFQDAKYINRCLEDKKEEEAIDKFKDNIETLKWMDEQNGNTSLIERAALNGCNKFVTLFNEITVCIRSQHGIFE